jgi:hypothetical protein
MGQLALQPNSQDLQVPMQRQCTPTEHPVALRMQHCSTQLQLTAQGVNAAPAVTPTHKSSTAQGNNPHPENDGVRLHEHLSKQQ